jgi:hypothetical protein
VAGDLAALIDSHPGHELILNGDTFSLTMDPCPRDPLGPAEAVLGTLPGLAASLRDHLARGDPVTLVAGNHDAALSMPGARSRLVAAIGCDDAAPFTIAPWLVRRGCVVLEHGHLYDPDNAPFHPLAPWRLEHEPLGVALTRRVVARLCADELAHAHEVTPLTAFQRALSSYGPRGLYLVGGCIATAVSLWWRAGRQIGIHQARATGRDRMAELASELGLEGETLERLVAMAPRPTHIGSLATFRRLYLDRLAAFAVLVGGGIAAPFAAGTGLLGLAGGAYLVGNIIASGNRYAGRTEERLRQAAHRVADLTSATLVVFGHSHLADQTSSYVNTGYFAQPGPRGRPYLFVDNRGRGELKRWAPLDRAATRCH